MKILKRDEKKGFLHIKADSPEDLWLLSRLINPNDSVRGSTERKIKIGGEDARNQKVVRKKMTLTLQAEKATYEHDSLRVLGVITAGPDDISRGEHHSITITPGDDLKIIKQWMGWQLDKLRESTKQQQENILVVLFDREEALFAQLKNNGYSILTRIKGNVQKKDSDESVKNTFWKDIAHQLVEYAARFGSRSVIAASPAFWKEYLKKEVPVELAKKVVYATVSDTNDQSLNELLKRPELKAALQDDRSAQENAMIDTLLHMVAKDKAAYGLAEVTAKAIEGNLKELFVSDNFMMEQREKNNHEAVEKTMKTAEQSNAKIMIVSSKDASKQLDGLGGIAGVLRW